MYSMYTQNELSRIERSESYLLSNSSHSHFSRLLCCVCVSSDCVCVCYGHSQHPQCISTSSTWWMRYLTLPADLLFSGSFVFHSIFFSNMRRSLYLWYGRSWNFAVITACDMHMQINQTSLSISTDRMSSEHKEINLSVQIYVPTFFFCVQFCKQKLWIHCEPIYCVSYVDYDRTYHSEMRVCWKWITRNTHFLALIELNVRNSSTTDGPHRMQSQTTQRVGSITTATTQ